MSAARPTLLGVEGVPPQAQRAAAHVAAETLPVEEEPLRAQALHHVHTLPAEVTRVAAPQGLGEVPPPAHTLQGRHQATVTHCRGDTRPQSHTAGETPGHSQGRHQIGRAHV